MISTEVSDNDWEDFWNSEDYIKMYSEYWNDEDFDKIWWDMEQIEPLTPLKSDDIPEIYKKIPKRY
tara:strand:- start:666 stop:863 length:198 start_codon:yes stop_codon:yes gene_type:complete